MIKAEDNSAKEHTLNKLAMIAVISSNDDVGIDGPTKFRGLWQMTKRTAIVAK